MALKRAVLLIRTIRVDARSGRIQIRITMSEHCSLYSVSKLLSERDRLAKTPFSNDPNKQYTVYAAVLPTTVTSHSLRHITGITQ